MVKIEADNQPAQPNDDSQKSAQQPPKLSNPLKQSSPTTLENRPKGVPLFPPGRPTKFSWVLARDFCILIQKDYMIEVCKRPDMPQMQDINEWMRRYPKFNQWVTRSRTIFADYLAERSGQLFDEKPPMEVMKTKNGEYERISMSGVQLMRYKSQAMQWLATRFNPEKYGDKLNVHNTNDWTQVLSASLTRKTLRKVQAMSQPIDVQP